MNEIIPPLAVCAVLMPLEAAVLPFLGLSTARADLPICAVALLALGSSTTLWGAIGAFAVGLLADVLIPVRPGLLALTCVFLFVLLRPLPLGREVRGPIGFGLLVFVATWAGELLMLGLLSAGGERLPGNWGWPVAQAALATALLAPLFYLLAGLVERVMSREDPSLLR